MHGRASFIQVLRQIAGLWDTRPGAPLLETPRLIFIRNWTAYTARANPGEFWPSLPDLLGPRPHAVQTRKYDPRFGGFGGAPKIPPSQPAGHSS